MTWPVRKSTASVGPELTPVKILVQYSIVFVNDYWVVYLWLYAEPSKYVFAELEKRSSHYSSRFEWFCPHDVGSLRSNRVAWIPVKLC